MKDKNGHKVNVICKYCGISFQVKPSVIKKGRGKYHSVECANLAKRNKKLSEKHKKNIGLGGLGKHHKSESILLMKEKAKRGSNSPNYKNGLPKCEKCGKQLSHYKNKYKLCKKCYGLFKRQNPECLIKSIYDTIRNSVKYKIWRQMVYVRDNFTCQDCNDNTGGNLRVHHKKPFIVLLEEAKNYMLLLSLYEASMLYVPLWNIDNGVTLCENCHEKRHKKRSYQSGKH
jgi:5-methylcytosine-specific restriction endonuclease McrA